MTERLAETIVGALVALVAIGFFVFATGQARSGESGTGVEYVARFQRVDGIAIGSDVRVSGVKVGVVRSIELDPTTYLARVTLTVQPNVRLLDETTARVASDGLLGGAYIALEPAGTNALAAGGEIINTQGSTDLLTLLASAAGNMGNSNNSSSPSSSEPASSTPESGR